MLYDPLYTAIWKTEVLCRGNVRQSVRLFLSCQIKWADGDLSLTNHVSIAAKMTLLHFAIKPEGSL